MKIKVYTFLIGTILSIQLLTGINVSAKETEYIKLNQLSTELKNSINEQNQEYDLLSSKEIGYYSDGCIKLDAKSKIKHLSDSTKIVITLSDENLEEINEVDIETESTRIVIPVGENETTELINTNVETTGELEYLGNFRITHYCPCSICCGAYANGITATGTVATAGRTIAVSPSEIPYGSKVMINGNIYIAEDCGSGINNHCIDIYVNDHQEALNKGVYYTDVYLVKN